MEIGERVENLEEKYSNLHTAVNVLAAEMRDFKEEMRDFKDEMRQQNQMRHAEILANDEKIAGIRHSIDEMNRNVRNISYTTIAAIGAMVVTVLLNLPK